MHKSFVVVIKQDGFKNIIGIRVFKKSSKQLREYIIQHTHENITTRECFLDGKQANKIVEFEDRNPDAN